MNNIKVHIFPNGKKAYTTQGLEITYNKTKPVSIEEIEVEKDVFEEFTKDSSKISYEAKDKKFTFKNKEKKE